MKNAFTTAVDQIQGLTSTQHKVLKAIAQFTDNQTGECFPSMTTIATAADVARSTVQLAIDDLLELGYLEIVGKRATKHASVNVYRVVPTPGFSRTDPVVPISTDPPVVPISHTDFVVINEAPQNQQIEPVVPISSRTDRYRTDQLEGIDVRYRQETDNPQTPINTDITNENYCQLIVDRFARCKNPGKDALQYAKEIMCSVGFCDSEPWDRYLPNLGVTIGENGYRNLVDIIGWIFEINAHDTNPRAFIWADRTHTMKNLRDHLLRDKSKLWEAHMHFCTDWDGRNKGTRGEVAYALVTIDDPQACAWAAEGRQRRAKAKKAAVYSEIDED